MTRARPKHRPRGGIERGDIILDGNGEPWVYLRRFRRHTGDKWWWMYELRNPQGAVVELTAGELRRVFYESDGDS